MACNQALLDEGDWCISAIKLALLQHDNIQTEKATVFSTYFPSLEEIKLLVYFGIVSIYYLGGIPTDPETVLFLNQLNKESISLEIIHLEEK